MAGLVEIAAPLKFLCCAREQMLHEQKLRLHESGLSRTPVVRSGRSEWRLLDTQASIRQSRLAWRSGPVPIKTSHQRAQPRRLRVSPFALIAVEPASTAAQPIFGKHLKRRPFSDASRFG
jgi:hypothetical protein